MPLVTRKYVKDYKLSEYRDADGKIKTESVYVGSYFYFTNPALAHKTVKAFAVAAGVALISFIAAMIPNSGAMHSFYITLPFIFCALPLAYIIRAVWAGFTEKEPFVRSVSERFSNWLRYAPVFGAAISGYSLIAEGITAVASPKKMMSGDLVFSAGCALYLAAMLFIFYRSFAVKTEKR